MCTVTSSTQVSMDLAQSPCLHMRTLVCIMATFIISKLLSACIIAYTAAASLELHPNEYLTSAAKGSIPCTYHPVTSCLFPPKTWSETECMCSMHSRS